MNPRIHRRETSAGFTLVELLVVIVIIGILIGLLVPVIAGAVRTANNARVVAEITTLGHAMVAFKDKYGEFPPSRIILSENGNYDTSANAYSTTLASYNLWLVGPNTTGTLPAYKFGGTQAKDDLTVGQLAERSLRYLRKFFPRASFYTGGSPFSAAYGWHDFNGNGVMDPGYILLEGHEAIAFWLGGIPNYDGTTIGMTGFAKDPINPFKGSTVSTGVPAPMVSASRYAPLFEFTSGRLADEDGDGIPGFFDPLNTGAAGHFYAYFSAYGNNSYDPNDVNFNELSEGGVFLARPFRVNLGLPNGNTPASPAPNPYTSSLPVPFAAAQAASYINPNTFQIISAGGDGLYGLGGQYLPNANGDKLPNDPITTSYGEDVRLREHDNLANFGNARLD